jgi:hypothetical protein
MVERSQGQDAERRIAAGNGARRRADAAVSATDDYDRRAIPDRGFCPGGDPVPGDPIDGRVDAGGAQRLVAIHSLSVGAVD